MPEAYCGNSGCWGPSRSGVDGWNRARWVPPLSSDEARYWRWPGGDRDMEVLAA